MPKDISYRVKFFEKDEQQDIFDVKGWFRFDDHNDENLITTEELNSLIEVIFFSILN